MKYIVQKISDCKQIEYCQKFEINQYMWNSKKEPKVYGWMGYIEEEGLFVRMVCEESNPLRKYVKHRDPVYQDSTMEIFLAFPEDELSNDSMYTNFEINANGAMYAAYGRGRNNREFLSDKLYEKTKVKAFIEEERWYIEVLFPEVYLKEICDFDRIKEGSPFYCNFYKISESDEILHFGSYAPIVSDKPNFHLPVFFAEASIKTEQ